MSDRCCRSAEKESYWRGHLECQLSSGESIRGFCRGRGLSEASFHFWRCEIGVRDCEASGKRGLGSAGSIEEEKLPCGFSDYTDQRAKRAAAAVPPRARKKDWARGDEAKRARVSSLSLKGVVVANLV